MKNRPWSVAHTRIPNIRKFSPPRGPIATKFCTGIDNQSISSNMEKMHKINDVIDNDLIIVRKLAEKTVKRV